MATIYGVGLDPAAVLLHGCGIKAQAAITEMGHEWVSSRAFRDILTRHPCGMIWYFEDAMHGVFVGDNEAGFLGYRHIWSGESATQLIWTDAIGTFVKANPQLVYTVLGVRRT